MRTSEIFTCEKQESVLNLRCQSGFLTGLFGKVCFCASTKVIGGNASVKFLQKYQYR